MSLSQRQQAVRRLDPSAFESATGREDIQVLKQGIVTCRGATRSAVGKMTKDEYLKLIVIGEQKGKQQTNNICLLLLFMKRNSADLLRPEVQPYRSTLSGRSLRRYVRS